MFGKLQTEPRKAKKRHGLSYWVIGTFTFAIESMLGINASFLVHESIVVVLENMLEGTSLLILSHLIAIGVSLAVGICFIAGGMWIFGGFMDSLGDARSYKDEYDTGDWPMWLVWLMFAAILGIDFTTLAFRASFFNEKGAGPLFVFFVILIFLPPILGCLMHVFENTPRDRRLSKTRRYAEAIETDDMVSVAQTMDPDLRARWLEDDPTAVTEHYERIAARQEEAEHIERQRIASKEEKRKKAQRPLASASVPQQARHGSRSQQ